MFFGNQTCDMYTDGGDPFPCEDGIVEEDPSEDGNKPDPAKLSEQVDNLNRALTEARTSNKALKERLDAYDTAEAVRKQEAEEAARRQAEAQGEHEQLYKQTLAEKTALEEQLAAATAQVGEFQTREEARQAKVTETNTARIEKIPEDRKTLVPTGMTPDALATWLNANQALLFTEEKRPTGTLTRAPHGSGDKLTIPPDYRAEIEEKAAKQQMDPQVYFERVWLKSSVNRRRLKTD